MNYEEYGVTRRTKSEQFEDVHVENLIRNGFTVIDSGLSANEICHLKDEIIKLRDIYEKEFSGLVNLETINEHNTIRCPFLFDKIFLDICFNKKLLKVVDTVLSGNFILNQQNVIINPGQKKYNQGLWHRDLPYQHFTISSPLALNALFCVDDFTQENGSTHVLPGTHNVSEYPSKNFIKFNEKQVTAKSGQFILIDSMMYHKGGYNKTKQDRMAINNVYSSPIIRPQIEFHKETFRYNIEEIPHDYIALMGFKFNIPKSIEEYLVSRLP